MADDKELENYRKLVQEVLNYEYSFGLQLDYKFSIGRSTSMTVDLYDSLDGALVEIVKYKDSAKRPDIIKKAANNIKIISSNFYGKKLSYYLVFYSELNNNDRSYYNRHLNSIGSAEYQILDRNDIIELAKKNNIDVNNFLIENLKGYTTGKNADLELNPSKDIGAPVAGSKAPNQSDNRLKRNSPSPPPGLSEDGEIIDANPESSNKPEAITTTSTATTADISDKKKSTKPNSIDISHYDVHGFARDVLNKEYDLAFDIEAIRVINGVSLKIDFSDENKNTYAQIIDKSKYVDLISNSASAASTDEVGIMTAIFGDIESKIDFLKSDGAKVQQYFSVFINGFTDDDIGYAKKWFKNQKNYNVVILTINDLVDLALKNDLDVNSDILVSYKRNRPPSPPGLPEEEIKEANIKTVKDKIPFHLDQVVNEDKLGRAPVAKAFVNLLKKDIFTDKLNHSFIVHLQGKWGAGKSSFLNFIKHNLKADGENWIIIDYNAWQNQHISPPWWTFIDQVYLQSRHQIYLIGIRSSLYFRCKEGVRRIWRYSGWDKISAFIITLVSIICIIYFGEDIINIFSTTLKSEDQNSSLSFFGDFGKLILTLSLLGALYGFTKFITVPFFINSSKEAKSFELRASDPMNQVKKHFNDLVDNINSKKKKRQLAIFIDDIDRCDKEYIVQLLEGIQTLFKDKRVLYIIAGDKNWISTSFGNTYEDFATKEVNKQQLGEFFIEKAFQLSFRLPNISEDAKQNYWDHILGMEKEKDKKINSIEELADDKQDEIKADLKESKSELTNPEFVKGLQEKYNLSGDTASNIVIEEKNKHTEELKHLLQEYHKYIDTNPRSIIRLANNYTMARSILMAERVSFNEHKLFRWLVIEDICPEVKSIVTNTESVSQFEKIIQESKDIVKRNNSIKLLKGKEDFMEGEIEIKDIKTIKGL